MPFLTFPDPPGPYAVGQCDAFWKEEWGEGDKKKQIVVRIFYPVDKDVADKYEMAHWLPEKENATAGQYAEAYAKFMWRPGTLASWLGSLAFLPLMPNISTKTLDSAPAASTPEKFRPVIYSHGLGGNRSCYSAVCIGLASHGYFVVAPEHTDGSAAISIHPDQTVVNHTYVPAKSQITGRQHRIPGGFTSTLIPERDKKPITQYQLRRKQLDHRVAEIQFLVDCLQHVTAGDERVPLPEHLSGGKMLGRLDMDRLSAVGHSFGASTCITVCKQDERFKACVAHDAWLFPLSGEMMQATLRVPTLFLTADTFDMLWPEEGKKVLDSFLIRSHEDHVDVQVVGVVGTKHQNYSDFPVLAPDLLMSIGVAGPTEPVKAMEIIHRLDSSFLEHHLSGSTTVYHVPEDVQGDTKEHEVDAWARTRSTVRVGVFTNDSEAGAKHVM